MLMALHAEPGLGLDAPPFWGRPTTPLDECEENYAVTPLLGEAWSAASDLVVLLLAALGLRWAQGLRRGAVGGATQGAGARARAAAAAAAGADASLLYGALMLAGLCSLVYHATLFAGAMVADIVSVAWLLLLAAAVARARARQAEAAGRSYNGAPLLAAALPRHLISLLAADRAALASVLLATALALAGRPEEVVIYPAVLFAARSLLRFARAVARRRSGAPEEVRAAASAATTTAADQRVLGRRAGVLLLLALCCLAVDRHWCTTVVRRLHLHAWWHLLGAAGAYHLIALHALLAARAADTTARRLFEKAFLLIFWFLCLGLAIACGMGGAALDARAAARAALRAHAGAWARALRGGGARTEEMATWTRRAAQLAQAKIAANTTSPSAAAALQLPPPPLGAPPTLALPGGLRALPAMPPDGGAQGTLVAALWARDAPSQHRHCGTGAHGPLVMEPHEDALFNACVFSAIAVSAVFLLLRVRAADVSFATAAEEAVASLREQTAAAFALSRAAWPWALPQAQADAASTGVTTHGDAPHLLPAAAAPAEWGAVVAAANATVTAASALPAAARAAAASCDYVAASLIAAAAAAESLAAIERAPSAVLPQISLTAVFAPFYCLPVVVVMVVVLSTSVDAPRGGRLARVTKRLALLVPIPPSAISAVAVNVDADANANASDNANANTNAGGLGEATALAALEMEARASRRENRPATRKDFYDVCDFVGWCAALHVSIIAAALCFRKASGGGGDGGGGSSWTTLLSLVHPGGWLVGQLAYWVVCLTERVSRKHAPRFHAALFRLLG
eukprot:g3598.t1